jgi:hypothetical protein
MVWFNSVKSGSTLCYTKRQWLDPSYGVVSGGSPLSKECSGQCISSNHGSFNFGWFTSLVNSYFHVHLLLWFVTLVHSTLLQGAVTAVKVYRPQDDEQIHVHQKSRMTLWPGDIISGFHWCGWKKHSPGLSGFLSIKLVKKQLGRAHARDAITYRFYHSLPEEI